MPLNIWKVPHCPGFSYLHGHSATVKTSIGINKYGSIHLVTGSDTADEDLSLCFHLAMLSDCNSRRMRMCLQTNRKLAPFLPSSLCPQPLCCQHLWTNCKSTDVWCFPLILHLWVLSLHKNECLFHFKKSTHIFLLNTISQKPTYKKKNPIKKNLIIF